MYLFPGYQSIYFMGVEGKLSFLHLDSASDILDPDGYGGLNENGPYRLIYSDLECLLPSW